MGETLAHKFELCDVFHSVFAFGAAAFLSGRLKFLAYNSIKELEQTPQPSFFQVFWYRRPIWLFAISLLILLVAVYLLSCDIYDWVVYSLCAVSLVVFILSAFSLAKIDLDSPVQIAENSFNRALHRYYSKKSGTDETD